MQGTVMSGAPVRRARTPCVPHRVRSRASKRGHGSRRRRAGKSHVARPPRSAQRSRAAPRLPLQRGRCFSCAAKELRGAPACGGGRELGAPSCAPSGAGGGRRFCFSPRGEGEALAAPTCLACAGCGTHAAHVPAAGAPDITDRSANPKGAKRRGHQANPVRDWPRFAERAVMLSARLAAHLPRTPARPRRARCPLRPATGGYRTRRAPSLHRRSPGAARARRGTRSPCTRRDGAVRVVCTTILSPRSP